MSERIVFLDFDGVLNTTAFLQQVGGAEVGHHWLDPSKVRLLAGLVRRSGARVVFSTSWRYMFTPRELAAMLRRHGFKGEASGVTPIGSTTRGEEIQAWLAAQAAGPARWVALDDDTSGMAWLGERHIRTTMDEGLLPAHVEAAARLLGE